MAQSVLGKINYLTEEQYQNAKANGQINEDEIYMTPDNTKTQDVRLFYNAAGYMGNIQLGVNKSQFEKLRIIYVSNGSDYRCAEIPTTLSLFYLYGIDNNGSGTAAWMKRTAYTLSENAITIQNAFWKNINSSENGTDNCIKIIEVLGVSPSDHIKSFETTPDIYSTAETIIGEFLGKPLYRKVFNTISVSGNSSSTTAHGISNLDAIARYTAHSYYNGVFRPITYATGSIYTLCEIDKTNIYIYNTTANPYTITVIMEYTKTTD